MQLFIHIIIITLGLLIGSFLNVCIYRIPRRESIAFPPSHCFNCGKNLKPLDLIPVVSYIFLRGRCRNCKSLISVQYPLIELLNSLVYLLLFLHFGLTIEFGFYAALSSMLIVVSIIDYYHKIIPDRLNLIILVLGILFKLTSIIVLKKESVLLDSIWGFLVGGGIFLLIAIVTNGAMGGGDIKLMAALGIWFGLKEILLISLLSFILGSVISIMLLIAKLKSRKDEVPFGPFICISAFLSLLYADEIIDLYLNLLLKLF